MIYLAHPWFLLLLLAVPVLGWVWQRQRRGTIRFPDINLFSRKPGGRGRAAQLGGLGLRMAILGLLVVLVAGPRLANWRSRIPTEGISIVVLLDVSGSMAAEDFQWQNRAISRLEAAKQALRFFVAGGEAPDGSQLEGRPNDLIGVVAFATWPDSVCPLTLSHSVLLNMVEKEEPRRVPGESSTNISDAIALGLHRLESAPTRRKVLVLLTDGEHNVDHPKSGWKPRRAAQMAADLQVPIYTIDAGNETGSDDYPGAAPSDPEQRAKTRARAEQSLRAIASITSGKYFEARDTRALLEVCREIDRLEKNEIRSFQYEGYHDLFPFLGAAVIAWMVLLQLLERTIWLRIP